jgi:hypothetical protein
LVNVAASTIKRGTRVGAEVCEHTFSEQIFYTDNIPGSWVSIDLKKNLVSPTFYSMSHRCAMNDFFVRNWRFEGSKDGMEWTIIREHVHDETLGPRGFSASWPVDGLGEFFSQFRVVLADNGNSRGTNALVLSCFEVYGHLAQ